MKCVCWNVRGLNGDTRQVEVKRWITSSRPLIDDLLETRVKHPSIDALINRTFPGWNFEANYSPEANNGRIVVVWNPLLSVITYFKSDQLVLCGVFNPATNQSFTVAFVYVFLYGEVLVLLSID